MIRVVIEYEFVPPLSDERLKQMAAALAPCTAIRQIRRLRTVLSEDRTRGYCEVEAPDAETVREAYRSARIAFRSVWTAGFVDEPAPLPA